MEQTDSSDGRHLRRKCTSAPKKTSMPSGIQSLMLSNAAARASMNWMGLRFLP